MYNSLFKNYSMKYTSQIGGSGIQQGTQYTTDFKIRRSDLIFGDNTKNNFGIDFLVDTWNGTLPDGWKYRHWDPKNDYVAMVTFTSHNYPNSHVSLKWNIVPSQVDVDEKYRKTYSSILQFETNHEKKILEMVKKQFVQKYPHLVLNNL